MMDKKLLAFLIVVIIFIVSVTIFAFIYHSYNKDDSDPDVRTYTHAFYTSITIQTGIGLSDPPNPHRKSLQIWVMVQSVITYLIALGVVFILVKMIFKEDDTFEKRIEKDVYEMKKMISDLHEHNSKGKKYGK